MMPRQLRVYVASSWRNEHQQHVVEKLREDGHEVYDFRHPHLGAGAGGTGFDWAEIDSAWEQWTAREFIEALEHEVARAGYDSDQTALDWCDAIVFVQPCGRSSHLEAGWGAGAGKLTIGLLVDGEEPELMYSMIDALFYQLGEVRTELLTVGPALTFARG